MPRTSKNSNRKLSECISSDANQLSLSKYFSPIPSKPTNLRKRPADLLDISKTSENVSPSKKPAEIHLVSGDDNLARTFQLSESTKNHLLTFSYHKQVTVPEDHSERTSTSSACNVLHHSKFLKTDHFAHISSACDSDAGHSVGSDTNQDVSHIRKKIKYTPLEKQYLELKAEYSDAILLIECGYKYRFFDKDAEIASKELNIGCFKYHNFMSAIIPTHRLHFHVRRLVYKGYKVGVVKQTESAALKAAGENKNELFSRKLFALYTKSTFIDGEISPDSEDVLDCADINDANIGSGYLMCVYETPLPNEKLQSVLVAVVAVQVSSGQVFYASFEDNFTRNILESHLLSLNPSELLIPASSLSRNTENLLNSFCSERSLRIEKFGKNVFSESSSLNNVLKFLSEEKMPKEPSAKEDVQMLLSLPPLVLSCLSALFAYLSTFKLENILKNIKNMRPISTSDHMILNAATLRGLDILQSNYSDYASLLWVMNKTLTKFGARLLKLWIARPLKNIQKIEERLNIVTEIIHSDSVVFKMIERSLCKIPDLEKILCSVFYQKCSCNEFLKLVQVLTKIKNEFLALADKVKSEVEVLKLKDILCNVLNLLEGIEIYSFNIDEEAARTEDKIKLFHNTSMYPSMELCKSEISCIEGKLNDVRPEICKILRLPGFKYSTVSGLKYLIEIPNSHLPVVPKDWLKISATKQVSRFRSPEVINLCKELDQLNEKLLIYASEAWNKFLNDFNNGFFKYKKAVSYLAELDCYLSFAKLAKEAKYCRPLVCDTGDHVFEVQSCFHPTVLKLKGEESQFVANDIKLNSTERCMIVTGPNMGGKSTYIRQVAILAVMSHIGSYVPAEFAKIPLLDGIYVRMGANDDLVNKRSTFMSEMSETSEILSSATSKSLVLLDELGRGTSTNDGAAIAFATLEYLLTKVRSFTLFVTHYPEVVNLKNRYPENIITVHMAYILSGESAADDDIKAVTFLYNVVPGISEKSYGINVAALAGIPKDILLEAQQKSREMELKIKLQRKLTNYLKQK